MDTGIDPFVLFELYFDADVVKRIIESTLVYAEEKKEDLRDSYCKLIKKIFTKAEFLYYIGVLILLGLRECNGLQNKAQTLIRLSELMTCERYKVIGPFLHLVTPEEENTLSGNRLCKFWFYTIT